MKIHPQDLERLEELELLAKTADEELERLKEQQFEINVKILKLGAYRDRRVMERDTFKAALEGMKDGKYAV